MATDSLATPKLRLKPVLLIGTIAALAGVLVGFINYLCTVSFFTDGHSPYILITTPLFQIYWNNNFSNFTSILDGNLLEWLVRDVVAYLLPAVLPLLMVLAVVLFGAYILGGYRAKRGTVLLPLSLLLLSGNALFSAFYSMFSLLYNYCGPAILNMDFSHLSICFENMLIALVRTPSLWIKWLIGLAFAGILLLAAVLLMIPSRGAKIAATVLVALHAVLAAVWFVGGLLSLIGSVVMPLISWVFKPAAPINLSLSSFLSPITGGAVALFFALFTVLLIANVVCGKKTVAEEEITVEETEATEDHGDI